MEVVSSDIMLSIILCGARSSLAATEGIDNCEIYVGNVGDQQE